jgi:preprotein translocase subunit SecD
MRSAVWWRASLMAVLVVISGAMLAPSMPTVGAMMPSWWETLLGARGVRLGLDLRGGSYLLFTVDLERAQEMALDRRAEEIRRALSEAQIGAVAVARDGDALRVTVGNPNRKAEAESILGERFRALLLSSGGTDVDKTITARVDPGEARQLEEYAIDQSLETIRSRIDQFGVAEPIVQRQGSREILVQLPGIQEPERAKALIGKTAVLEFRLVHAQNGTFSPDAPPAGAEVLPGLDADATTGRVTRTQYLVEDRVELSGDSVADARMQLFDQLDGPFVELSFDQDGARRFDELTAANVGRQLAIILDDVVHSAPVIRERIPGGVASITGNFELKEARDLAIVLRAGALPAPVTLIEERTVGPSLGSDSIRQGIQSFVVGGAVVAVFMIVYYRGAGFLAVSALVLNVVYLLGALAGFGATLTLPGIAGIVLTLGMAVDANVLINERIREELRLGKTPRAAIEAGYDRAWSAILDSNLTTFLSGLILFQFGAGPVRGFAVTLCIGIVTSMFTAVFGTRTVYEYLLTARRLRRVSV